MCLTFFSVLLRCQCVHGNRLQTRACSRCSSHLPVGPRCNVSVIPQSPQGEVSVPDSCTAGPRGEAWVSSLVLNPVSQPPPFFPPDSYTCNVCAVSLSYPLLSLLIPFCGTFNIFLLHMNLVIVLALGSLSFHFTPVTRLVQNSHPYTEFRAWNPTVFLPAMVLSSVTPESPVLWLYLYLVNISSYETEISVLSIPFCISSPSFWVSSGIPK